MKNLVNKFLLCAALLASCFAPVAARAQQDWLSRQSGVFGKVEGGLGVWTVTVVSQSGEFVTSLNTEKRGNFLVYLKPGTYVLTPYFVPPPTPGGAQSQLIIEGLPATVKVTVRHFTFADLQGMLRFPLPPHGPAFPRP